MLTAVGWYAIVVGAAMAVWWTLDLRTALTRGDRARGELLLHLAAELLTAGVLVVGGVVVLGGGTSGVLLVGLGMLLYTVVQSPGYFLARGEREPVVMFGTLVVLTLASITVVLTD